MPHCGDTRQSKRLTFLIIVLYLGLIGRRNGRICIKGLLGGLTADQAKRENDRRSDIALGFGDQARGKKLSVIFRAAELTQ